MRNNIMNAILFIGYCLSFFLIGFFTNWLIFTYPTL